MRKKGFTLVEIIVCIALLSIIALITIISINNNKKEKDNKAENEIQIAIEVLIDKLKEKKSLKNTGTYNDYFCIKKDTLINEGLITEENKKIKELKEDSYIKVTLDEVGGYNLSYNATSNDCFYIKSEIDFENKEAKVISKDGENGYYLSQQLLQTEINNTFGFLIDFNFNTAVLKDYSEYMPENIYTIFIVDGSGSMCTPKECDKTTGTPCWIQNDISCKTNGSSFQKAVDASILLSEKLIEKNDGKFKYYVSAITFDNDLDKQTEFKSSALSKDDFYTTIGGTRYVVPLKAAYDQIKATNTKQNNRYFIIFLTDGVDTYSGYIGDKANDIEVNECYPVPNNKFTGYLECIKSIISPENTPVEFGKIISIAYNFVENMHSEEQRKKGVEDLKNIASENCDVEGNKCFFETTEGYINKVFENVSTIIEKEVKCSSYKKINFSITLGDNFRFSTGEQTKIISDDETGLIKLECDENNITTEIQTQTLLNKALYYINFIEPEENTLNEGVYDFNIIDNITIKFLDAANNEVEEINLTSDEFPKVKLKLSKVDVIN